MKRVWCNGQWLDPQDFLSPPMDRGSIHGLGLFETMLAIDGVLLFADRHFARLRSGHERLGWSLEFPDFQEIAAELLLQNGLGTGRARVRLTVTGGSGPIHDLTPGTDRLVWMSAFPALVPPESITACLSPWPRNERSALAGLKCASYSENLIALDHARRFGFDETIFLNTAGQLCEAATANLFLVSNGTLLTPSLDSGCLPGITRELVIELAAEIGIPCVVGALAADQLQAAEEILLTSSTIGVLPVSRLGDRALPSGPVTRQLCEALESCHAAGPRRIEV
jgi:branched-subunit amino acid aminotransferase/4-amino-4-deoxychorismate lyase